MSGIHTNLDPMTGNCRDCGARREQIDDNLISTCEKIVGPHRLAIMALRDLSRGKAGHAELARQVAAAAESEAVRWSHEARALQADAEALAATAEVLRSLTPQPESSSRVMQRAADAIIDPPRP